MPPITKLLVANRGEIARRVFRTCGQMGIDSVAVFSDPDRNAPFVSEAGEAISLGGATPAESYLRIDAVLEAARRTGADAVHPGYGFLAENPEFAAAVVEAGLTWVGPSPSAIRSMGSKLESKRLMTSAGVPNIESIDLSGMDDEEAATAAHRVGFPVLVKASAGGGGKGMRIVRVPAALAEAVAGARREAAAAFGDETVFLEQYLDAPRHIEIQVFGDTHGNIVSLFERECSIQRRHQKIIEESPSTALTPTLREEMGRAAVAAAKSVEYVGAGTVEFLFQDGDFFFLEMNTRLQVEHPVTEAITGLDLVRLQLLVAAGEPLPTEALEPTITGHSIEARLYAEDPRNEFLPVTGKLDRFRFEPRPGLRVDTGVEDGSEISVHYDPMLAKVVAWSPTRLEAASVLADALKRAEIHGSVTNRDLLVRILRHSEFMAGDIDTHFLERHDPAEMGAPLPDAGDEGEAALAAALSAQIARRSAAKVLSTIPSGWRNSPSQLQRIRFAGEAGIIDIGYRVATDGTAVAELGADSRVNVRILGGGGEEFGLEVDGRLGWYRIQRAGDIHHVDGPAGYSRLLELPRFPSTELEDEPGSLHAPMPGKVIQVEAEEGDVVEEGQVLMVMEAMKMEHTLRAPISGTIREIRAALGDQVEADEVLVVVEER